MLLPSIVSPPSRVSVQKKSTDSRDYSASHLVNERTSSIDMEATAGEKCLFSGAHLNGASTVSDLLSTQGVDQHVFYMARRRITSTRHLLSCNGAHGVLAGEQLLTEPQQEGSDVESSDCEEGRGEATVLMVLTMEDGHQISCTLNSEGCALNGEDDHEHLGILDRNGSSMSGGGVTVMFAVEGARTGSTKLESLTWKNNVSTMLPGQDHVRKHQLTWSIAPGVQVLEEASASFSHGAEHLLTAPLSDGLTHCKWINWNVACC